MENTCFVAVPIAYRCSRDVSESENLTIMVKKGNLAQCTATHIHIPGHLPSRMKPEYTRALRCISYFVVMEYQTQGCWEVNLNEAEMRGNWPQRRSGISSMHTALCYSASYGIWLAASHCAIHMMGRGQPGGWRQRKISRLKLQLGQLGKGYLVRSRH